MGNVEQNEDLRHKYEELQSEFNDLQLMYDNTLEHGTALENELMTQNDRMTELQNKMRKYLSPQLYQALLGGTADATIRSHSRKRLTIYFSDIVGFSDLTDSIEPELLSDILNTYLTRMSEIALKHSGTVDKFIGDAILVFFGAPEFVDDETHARSCVRMALEMREELYRLREEWRLKGINRTLQVRAGINTGYCTIGNFGSEKRMDYTIIGGQVNMASRLQSSANPDSIFISGSTYSLVEDIVEAKSLGLLQVKGIHTPVEAYDLVGLKKEATPEDVAAYVRIEGSRLRMSELDTDLAGLSATEISALRKALSGALALIAKQGERQSAV